MAQVRLLTMLFLCASILTRPLGNPNSVQDFNMLWISEFKRTNAYEVWDRVTDPLLFDIVEPR